MYIKNFVHIFRYKEKSILKPNFLISNKNNFLTVPASKCLHWYFFLNQITTHFKPVNFFYKQKQINMGERAKERKRERKNPKEEEMPQK